MKSSPPCSDPSLSGVQLALIPGADSALDGFTPNQQVEVLGEMDDF